MQIHINRGGYTYITWQFCEFVAIILHKVDMAVYSNYLNHTRKRTVQMEITDSAQKIM